MLFGVPIRSSKSTLVMQMQVWARIGFTTSSNSIRNNFHSSGQQPSLPYVCGGTLNEASVDHWYKLLQEIIEKYKIDPDMIFAMDETCCSRMDSVCSNSPHTPSCIDGRPRMC